MRPDEMSLEEQLIASTAVANYRKTKEMADKLIFQTNVPETIALKYANGKRVESRYNEYEVYYSLTDGRALYASPALAQRIEALAPAAGELFSICKKEVRDGQRKRIEWQVGPADSGEKRVASGEPTPTPRPVPVAAPRPVSAPAAPLSQDGSMTKIVTGAMVAAIDALDQAAKYAETKGIALIWSPEDYRTMASTIVIQFFRDRETRARYGGTTAPEGVNGGAAWQQ